MSKSRWGFVIGLVVISIAVATKWWGFRNTTTHIGSEEIHNQFEGDVGSSPGDPGIYRYRTNGFEQVDVLSGARHKSPNETFMTITAGDCGPVVRWVPLSERWTDWEHCTPDLAVAVSSSYHDWFGIPDLEIESCVEPRPITGAAGEVTTTVCESDRSLETYETTIMGSEVRDVAGVSIETTYMRRVSLLSEGSQGTAQVDVWRVSGTALIVRMEVLRSSVTPSAVGDVTYTEEFVLELLGLTPERP